MSSSAPSFHIFSSLRYDPWLPQFLSHCGQESAYPNPQDTPYYLLAYHRDRLINAAQCFQWSSALDFLEKHDLAAFIRFLDPFIPDKTTQWRLRILLHCSGECKVEAYPTAPIPPLRLLVPSPGILDQPAESQSGLWRVYIDSQPIVPSVYTTHKTTARDDYNAARLRAGIQSPAENAEVLVVNPQGEVMEGSITTPYFRRRHQLGTSGAGAPSEPHWITPPLSSGGNAGTTRRYALAQGFCIEGVIKTAELVDGDECWLSNGVHTKIKDIILKRAGNWRGDGHS
ncbi:hypothetical protein MPDQ_002798 [Monascus purpureus]|uniref:Aminodeoxychorismate lyase n=1 Tax=Monascus purpureus TaxID=5098 RepID=A0A507R2V4_MONPU|nr:hypothetical protein MPDQ_002798 [Monascus purpureus]